MSVEFNPPLAVHFIWHPSDVSVVEPMLAEIKKTFARDKDKPFSRGLNIPLFFYSTQNPTEVPDHCPDEIRYACMSRPYARSYESDAVKHAFKLKNNGLFIKDMYESSDTGRASFNKFRIH